MEGILGLLILVTTLYPCICLDVTLCPSEVGCECYDRTINCSGRGLNEVPKKLPHPTSDNEKTVVLLLNSNNLTGLDKQVFQGLYISRLELSDNHLGDSVSDQAFTGMVGVAELVMDRCGLTSIPAAVSDLEDLTSLSLRGNHISSLPERIFSKLTKLKQLDLAKNQVHFGQEFKSFDHLNLLEYLDLSRNNLYSVPTEALSELPLLKTLILEDNPIRTLAENVFSRNGNLTTLRLLHNPMLFVHGQALAPLNKLETLEISNSKLTAFNSVNFGNKPNLMKLVMRHCTIETVDTSLAGDIVKNLTYLDISGTQSLWKSVRDKLHETGRKLEIFKLSDVQLKDIPTAMFKSWKNLSNLELRNNAITHVKKWAFEGVRGNNVEIHLENNNIIDLDPYMFKDTTLHLSLFLNGNVNITNLTFIFKNLCGFDHSVIDVTGMNFSCTCDTVKVVQKKMVNLNGGYCGEDSRNGLEGLKLTPGEKKLVPGIHLEAEGMRICGLKNRLQEKYSCCSDKWVALADPITCPVKSTASNCQSLASYTLIAFLIFLLFSIH